MNSPRIENPRVGSSILSLGTDNSRQNSGSESSALSVESAPERDAGYSGGTPFLVYAELVMSDRDQDGVRGLTREWSRFRCHLEGSPLAPLPLDTIRRRHIREWQRWMSQKDAADHREVRKIGQETIKRSQALVSAVFAHAVDREIIETNPCIGAPLKKRADESATRDKWAFLKIEEQHALSACDAIAAWDKLAFQFAIATGLRQGEQFNLELTDVHVDGSDPHVFVRYGWPQKGKKAPPKSGKTRKVQLSPASIEIVRACVVALDGRPNPLGLLFPSVRGKRRQQGKPLGDYRAVRRYYAAAGIALRPHLNWHSLRHSFGTNLATGVLGRVWSAEEIRIVMGHSSVLITQRYIHVADEFIAKAARETVQPVVPVAPVVAPVIPPAPPSNTNDTRSILAEGAQRVRDYVTKHLPDVVVKRARLLFSRRVA